MSRGAMAFLAGMGTGYIKAKDKEYERARQEKLDQQQNELHTAKMDEINRAKQDRTDLKVAGAPSTVREMEGPQPEGQDQKPLGYIAGNGASARGFAEKGLADASAVEQNKPEARRARMSDLAAQGNALAGTALTGDMQREASQMTINEGHRKEANTVFDTGLRTALQTKGPEGLAEFMSASTADGQGGATKFKAVVSPDGKTWQMHQITGEGVTKPVGQAFSNNEDGYATAGFMLSRAVPESEKVKHLMDVKESERKTKHDEGTLKIQQQNADTQEQWRKDQAATARETSSRLAHAAKAAGATGGTGAYWSKDADEHIVKLNSFTNPETGRSEIDGNGAQFMQRVALDIAAKNGGNTMAAISRAAEVDQTLKVMSKGDSTMLAQLRNKALTDALAPKAQPVAAPAAPAPAPAPTPAATARAGIQPAAAPVPAKPAYSYAAQMAQANAQRLAKQAEQQKQEQAAQAAQAEQDRLIAERQKSFIASRQTR